MQSIDVEFDNDGYLIHLEDWSEQVASFIGDQEGIQLTDLHWQVIWLIREFYQEFKLSPTARPLTKYLTQHMGSSINNLQLNLLFNGNPAKIIAKIAGLPKPTSCL